MFINRIVLAAIILMILLVILKFVMKLSFGLFSLGMIILIILALVGHFKMD